MNNLPKARDKKIVVQESGNEILIYDLLSNKAHCLNETSAIVWRSCDGEHSVTEIAASRKLPAEFVAIAVDELQKANLLAEKVDTGFASDSVSRRKMLFKVGATAVALPVIASLVAPSAARAQSGAEACLGLNETFELTQTPFFETSDDCASALIQAAETRCCAGALNPSFGFEFGTDPQLCRGICGGPEF